MPFLENVTRGRNVPRERLEEVAHHYVRFGGVSPINAQNRELIAALERELREHGIDLPIYFGNRNWHPLLGGHRGADDPGRRAACARVPHLGVLELLRLPPVPREPLRRAGGGRAGRARAAAAPRCSSTTPASSRRTPTGCARRIEQAAGRARRVHRAQHPGRDGRALRVPGAARRDVRAWSPRRPAPRTTPSSTRAAAARRTCRGSSRTSSTTCASCTGGESTDVVVAPLGFLSDHLEVLYDLDVEAAELAEELGPAASCAPARRERIPRFVSAIRELIQERLDGRPGRPALGRLAANPDTCAPTCCLPGTGRPSPWDAVRAA